MTVDLADDRIAHSLVFAPDGSTFSEDSFVNLGGAGSGGRGGLTVVIGEVSVSDRVTATMNANIAGIGQALVKTGDGTLLVNGTSEVLTRLNAGTLVMNNVSNVVNVVGGTLLGAGPIDGSLSVQRNGLVSPGRSAGT